MLTLSKREKWLQRLNPFCLCPKSIKVRLNLVVGMAQEGTVLHCTQFFMMLMTYVLKIYIKNALNQN